MGRAQREKKIRHHGAPEKRRRRSKTRAAILGEGEDGALLDEGCCARARLVYPGGRRHEDGAVLPETKRLPVNSANERPVAFLVEGTGARIQPGRHAERLTENEANKESRL